MTDLSNLPVFVILPVCFLGGLGLGLGYFRALRAAADLIVNGGSPLLALALTLGRLGLLAVGFYLAVQLGGFALLSALVGVLCAKAMMLRSAGGAKV